MTLLSLSVKSITSLNDSTESSPDEPYVLVTGIDLTQLTPNLEVTLYGPWADVEKGETHSTLVIPPGLPQSQIDFLSAFNVVRRPFWGLDNKKAAIILNPTDVIFIVAVMENDDGHPDALRSLIKGVAVASLAASTNSPRKQRADKLLTDIKGVLKLPTGAPNFDDVVGAQELVLNAADLVGIPSSKRTKTLTFANGSEGTFRVTFELAFM